MKLSDRDHSEWFWLDNEIDALVFSEVTFSELIMS